MTDVLVWIIWCEVFDMKFWCKKCDFDKVVLFVNFEWLESIDLPMFWMIFEIKIDSFRYFISLLNMVFSVEFD